MPISDNDRIWALRGIIQDLEKRLTETNDLLGSATREGERLQKKVLELVAVKSKTESGKQRTKKIKD